MIYAIVLDFLFFFLLFVDRWVPFGGGRDLVDEKCVMNSYFGIGIDAKITLDFHTKREEHPEKCRSRARNYMWYGVLGGKELLQVTSRKATNRDEIFPMVNARNFDIVDEKRSTFNVHRRFPRAIETRKCSPLRR